MSNKLAVTFNLQEALTLLVELQPINNPPLLEPDNCLPQDYKHPLDYRHLLDCNLHQVFLKVHTAPVELLEMLLVETQQPRHILLRLLDLPMQLHHHQINMEQLYQIHQ